MFGIGGTEFAIILLFGFLLFGPDKLPAMGRTLGRAVRQFREAQEGITNVVQTEVIDPLNKASADAKTKEAMQRVAAEDSDIDEQAQDHAESFAEKRARLEAEKASDEQRSAAALYGLTSDTQSEKDTSHTGKEDEKAQK